MLEKTRITIREAAPEEFFKVAALRRISEPEQELGVQERAEKKFAEIPAGKRIAFFAEDSAYNRVIGSVQLQLVHQNPAMADGATIAHVDDLYVAAPYRNKGIGRQLMERLEEEASARGFSNITLAVRKNDSLDSLIEFYEKLGYEQLESNSSGPAIIMIKEIG